MKLLKTHTHPEVTSIVKQKTLVREAVRAIALKNKTSILLVYTKHYNDYALPGGGVHEGENLETALCRELSEETGAQNIRSLKPFGRYDEYRPFKSQDHDVLYMKSYCFTCEVDAELGSTCYEPYEIKNGMKPVWMDINQAIEHNKKVIQSSDKKGLSIERETFLLELVSSSFWDTP